MFMLAGFSLEFLPIAIHTRNRIQVLELRVSMRKMLMSADDKGTIGTNGAWNPNFVEFFGCRNNKIRQLKMITPKTTRSVIAHQATCWKKQKEYRVSKTRLLQILSRSLLVQEPLPEKGLFL